MTRIRCLLWDVGDTLCDERFIWSSGPEWMDVYQTFDDGPGASWCLGELNTPEFAEAISKRMGRSPAGIIAHMAERCHEIEFFPRTYDFFRARHLPQAIVTVNPDLFSDLIVPIYKFNESCEAIVTSWEERRDRSAEQPGPLELAVLPAPLELAELLLQKPPYPVRAEWPQGPRR